MERFQASNRIVAKMRCVKPLRAHIMVRNANSQTAEVHIRVAFSSRFKALRAIAIVCG